MRGRIFLRLSQLLAAITGDDIEVWDGQTTQFSKVGRDEKDKQRASYISWRCDKEKDMLTAMTKKPYGFSGDYKTQPPNWSFLVNIDNKCKGSLLSDRYVLTSPSCCQGKVGKMAYFHNGKKRLISNTIIHHGSANRDLNSEVCLIELRKPVPVGKLTQTKYHRGYDMYPACIMGLGDDVDESYGFPLIRKNPKVKPWYDLAYTVRPKWGFPGETEYIPLEMDTIDNCPLYRDNFQVDYRTMGCFKSRGAEVTKTLSNCDQDDGLPVVMLKYEDELAQYGYGLITVKLIGVISWTTGNCKQDMAGYMALVDPVKDWIKSIIQTEGFWENPGTFSPSKEMQKAEDGLLTVSQPIMCRSEIDGYGYTQDSEGIRL